MTETIRWESYERLVFFGRNGTGLCTGIEIFHNDGVVSLQPITSKNQVARCEITVPVSALSRLTRALHRLRQQSKNASA